MNATNYLQDTNFNYDSTSVLGAWQNLQIILGQQVKRYIQSVNSKNRDDNKNVSISNINGLLSFLEGTINNSFGVFLNQKISISKLETQKNPTQDSKEC